ncbi:hypothetical protein E2C01_026202 [Portunus trituberculatus]|uniref:Uncharacterized protein n=1 Tax=Portunus trituberculatus TaxID=210409 RepID=A0A5B7EF39_PORTR|nr:hypothetical protein [Portunus trituberculatus]
MHPCKFSLTPRNSPRSSAGYPASLFYYGASAELIDRSSGRAETTTRSTNRESEATTPRVTSHTYLLLGEQWLRGLLIYLAMAGTLGCELSVLTTTLRGTIRVTT